MGEWFQLMANPSLTRHSPTYPSPIGVHDMRILFSSWTVSMVCWGILAVTISGCGSKSESDYIPSDETVQHALESALTAWQNGKAPGFLEGTSPPVQVVDGQWQSGQKLKSFEILGEDEAEGAPRWFAVKLILESGQEQNVHYVIVGQKSVVVFRDEDYNRTTGMESNPPLKRKRR